MLVKFSSPPSAAVTTRGSRPRHTACIVVSDEDEIGLERHTRGAKRQVTCYINCKQGGETPLHPQHPHLVPPNSRCRRSNATKCLHGRVTGLRGCSVDRTTGATRLPASGQMLEHLLMLIGQANVGSTCSTNPHCLTHMYIESDKRSETWASAK